MLGCTKDDSSHGQRQSFLLGGDSTVTGAPRLPIEGLIAQRWTAIEKSLPRVSKYTKSVDKNFRFLEKDFEEFARAPSVESFVHTKLAADKKHFQLRI